MGGYSTKITKASRKAAMTRTMTHEQVRIDGMGCSHCVEAVHSALDDLGVQVHEVTIGTADISYDGASLDRSQIDSAIREAGYQPTDHVEV